MICNPCEKNIPTLLPENREVWKIFWDYLSGAFDFDAISFKVETAVGVLNQIAILDGGKTLKKIVVIAREYEKVWRDERKKEIEKK